MNWPGPVIEFRPAFPPLAGQRRGIRSQIQIEAADVIGTDGASDSRSRHGSQIDGRLRQAATRGDGAGEGPLFEKRALPSRKQRTSADSHAGGVLRLHAQEMALVESREAPVGAQVQPVLRNRQVRGVCGYLRSPGRCGVGTILTGGAGALSAQHRVVVDGF